MGLEKKHGHFPTHWALGAQVQWYLHSDSASEDYELQERAVGVTGALLAHKKDLEESVSVPKPPRSSKTIPNQ